MLPLQVTPIPYGNRIEVFDLGVDAVDTHVPRTDDVEPSADSLGFPTTRVEEGVFVPGRPAHALLIEALTLLHRPSSALLVVLASSIPHLFLA